MPISLCARQRIGACYAWIFSTAGTFAADITLSTAGPIRTPAEARDAARKAEKPVRVIVQPGVYPLEEPLVLGPEDSGVKWEAAPGSKPVFSGGRTLPRFTVNAAGDWETRVPKTGGTVWSFDQLWINGRRAVLARHPNTGSLQLTKVTEEKIDDKQSWQTVNLLPADLDLLKGASVEDLRRIQFLVYHKWDNTRRWVETLDPVAGTIRTPGKEMKKHNVWDDKSGVILENHRAFLDQPGEWFLAPDGLLTYKPLPGEKPESTEATAPRIEQLVILRGTAENKVRDVTFRSISFSNTGWKCPPTGFEPEQAAASIEAVIQADCADGIVIEDCEVAHTGLYGVWFRTGCVGNRIERCSIEDTGGGGVRFGHMGMPAKPADVTEGNILNNSIIRDGGLDFPCAVGVWIGNSSDNRVSHNEISYQSYSGVSVGWRWGYAESAAKRNIVVFNHIHHIGDGLLSDMGAVYTLGPSEGTVISNNHIHHVTARTYGGWGLYNDEGSTGILMENNLVTDTKTGSYHQHYGRENILRNNILAFSKVGQIQLTRPEPHSSFTITRNIVIWKDGPLLSGGGWDKGNYSIDRNLYYRIDGRAPDIKGMPFSDWQARGHDAGSQVADPKFKDPLRGDWSLAPDSPALAVGFQPFDPAQAGVAGDAEWVARAKRIPLRSRYPE